MIELPFIIAITNGLVETAKRAGLPGRFANLAAILIAVALSIGALFTDGQAAISAASIVDAALFQGPMAGLAAIGLYKLAAPSIKRWRGA